MRPLYDARVSDLGPDDRVKVECACGHMVRLTAMMLGTAGLPPHAVILDLRRRLKCQSCRWRGRADISIEWATVD
jgi:hypothetical protein